MNTMDLPKNYKWLRYEQSPRVLVAALSLFGIKEIKGKQNNPIIMQWGKELGLNIPNDEQAWCGLFVAIAIKLSGYEPIENPLWARNWATWGKKVPEAMLGDVCVFERGSGGHVGFYIGEDANYYHILGGNQSDSVSISRVAKNRALGFRRSPFKIGQPMNIRKVHLQATGLITRNEN